MSEQHDPNDAIGTVTHYFSHLSVAAVELSDRLRVGDRIHVQGHTTDLSQAVSRWRSTTSGSTARGPATTWR